MKILPELSIQLIETLNLEIPLELPKITMTDREIWYAIGRRSVVEYLNSKVADLKLKPYDEGDTNVFVT